MNETTKFIGVPVLQLHKFTLLYTPPAWISIFMGNSRENEMKKINKRVSVCKTLKKNSTKCEQQQKRRETLT